MNNTQRRERLKKLNGKTTCIKFKPVSNFYELRWPYPTRYSFLTFIHKQKATIDASTGEILKFSCISETNAPGDPTKNYQEKVDRRIRYLITKVKKVTDPKLTS